MRARALAAQRAAECPLSSRNRPSFAAVGTAGMCHKATYAPQQRHPLFDHLVGAERPPSAEQSFWNGPVLSFEPDARLTDDRDPAVVVGLDDPTEPIRRNFHQLAADSLETLLEIGHGLGDRPLETSDRGQWRKAGANSPIQESISR